MGKTQKEYVKCNFCCGGFVNKGERCPECRGKGKIKVVEAPDEKQYGRRGDEQESL